MTEKLDLTELLSISGLPGVSDADGNELVPYEPPEIKETTSNPNNRTVDLEHDYAAVRDSLYFQQQLLKLAALKAFENASMGDSPRHMEVLSTLFSQMTNNTRQLIDVHKQMKDITAEEVKTNAAPQPQITAEAGSTVFVGSPSELMAVRGAQLDVRSRREREVVDADQTK